MDEPVTRPSECTSEFNQINQTHSDSERFHLTISDLAQNIRRDGGKESGCIKNFLFLKKQRF